MALSRMASAGKRPRRANLLTEEGLEMVFQSGEDHGGMSSGKESELDEQLECESEISSPGKKKTGKKIVPAHQPSRTESIQPLLSCRVIFFVVVIIILSGSYHLWGELTLEERTFFSEIVLNNTEKTPSLLQHRKKNLKLVSFNLWCDFLRPFEFMNVEERIEGLAKGVEEYDIALIQEAYILKTGVTVVSKCARHLVSEMEKHGFSYRTSLESLVAPHIGNSAGIVIFSRIPLLNTTSRQYHNYSALQLADYRGFVIGEYKFNTKSLVVVNTHLDPHQVKARISQAMELTTALMQLTSPDVHIIVGGDFNIDNHYPTTSNSSKEYLHLLEIMAEAGLHSVFTERVETNIDGGHYDALFISSKINVGKKEIIKLFTKEGNMVSDHYGVSVELVL